MNRETNRTVARFEHDGKRYTIHERTNVLSDGSTYRRRFIFDDSGSWSGDARTVREARRVWAARIARDERTT